MSKNESDDMYNCIIIYSLTEVENILMSMNKTSITKFGKEEVQHSFIFFIIFMLIAFVLALMLIRLKVIYYFRN